MLHKNNGIPTLIIAVSGIDDAASVAIHGIVQSIMFSDDALWYQILQGPISIVGGLGFGILWGWLAKYIPEKGDVSTPVFSHDRFYDIFVPPYLIKYWTIEKVRARFSQVFHFHMNHPILQ
ncbi:hypothetical protein K0M31_012556 [Melipona bicolor]|uniref:Uncharacterized protein n=1 Tax=Melipona bicolor TaxID=60889 RepID=A0AA40KH79_9HYME|nr:hypothetical protein K0M31_012556 [Melipona bicolor]